MVSKKGQFTIDSEEDIKLLEDYICSNASSDQEPPKLKTTDTSGKNVWTMLDSGSVPNIANCKKFFPNSTIRRSKAQDRGVKYTNASGGHIDNEGEADVVHTDADGTKYRFTFQHADVQFPILSVRQLVRIGCKVIFTRRGGVIKYADGRRLRFVCKHGVFFV